MNKPVKVILVLIYSITVIIATIEVSVSAQQTPGQSFIVAQCPDAIENPLPLPSSLSPDDFHDKLLAFLQNTEYAKLKWCVDKGVRDTGPYVYSEYLGVHPAVRIYYSPAIMRWLVNGRIDNDSRRRNDREGNVSSPVQQRGTKASKTRLLPGP